MSWSQLTDLTLMRRSSVALLAFILPKCTQLHTLQLEAPTYGGHQLTFKSPLPALVHVKHLVFSRRSLPDICAHSAPAILPPHLNQHHPQQRLTTATYFSGCALGRTTYSAPRRHPRTNRTPIQWGSGETIFERLTLSTKGYFTSQPSNLIPKLSILCLAIYNAKFPVEDDR
ncbi:uncharacterized protein ARMOST_07613 [Armillaria ostoyae]|uniref:F-box domain-containing protein n=1 Tax=Armillaria ostoyae TaxID=47428 RepID=A0A284R6E4_ARMOS|nr:uncharacterized protein ARMOST_07613 [Armillaria ostoyae]